MELHQLEYFLSLAKYQNVSMVADFLNISQPALSKCLSQIEQEVGVKLFDRKGRHIYLNEYGKTLAVHVEQSLASLNRGILSARRLHKTILGSVNVSILSYGGILFPCVEEYTRKHPLVNFRFTYSLNNRPHHSPDDVDLILCSSVDDFYPGKDNIWVTQALFKEKYYIVVSPRLREYPADQTSINLGDLKEDPFVSMMSNELNTDLTYKYCNLSGFNPIVLYETDDFGMKLKFLQSGLCVGILPEACLKDASTFDPSLRFFEMEGISSERTVLLKRRKKIFMPEAVKSFWDFTMEWFHLPADERE